MATAYTSSSANSDNISGYESLIASTLPAYHEDGSHSNFRSREALIRTATFAVTSSSHTGITSVNIEGVDAGEAASQAVIAGDPAPDWNGIWRDTGILFGSQFVAAGIIYFMPESVSNWSSEQKRNTFKKYAENVFDPVVDKDQFYINYVLHPYWGATYYIRGRERGLGKVPSFVYSTLISAMYEFGVECFFEKPSIQDLIVTPAVGSLMGAFLFEPLRDLIKRKQELHWYDHAALVVTDPVGVLSLGIEKLFGIKSTIMVDYSGPQMQRRSTGFPAAPRSSRIGVVMHFPLD